ncbi:MAG: HEAT repeat domain-containing protein [Phycisphaerae bacterium]|nr:HEAT repeat domain-containing protein [Gemmatimonadaceae bacterium]
MTAEQRQDVADRAQSLAMVRALARLVDRLSAEGDAISGSPGTLSERRDAVREALRGLTGAARSGALHCYVDERGMHINDFFLLPAELRAEPALYGFARKIVSHAVGTLSIRQGAAPGELLTLGRLLADAPIPRPAPSDTTPDNVPRQTPTEVLRSWSVLVTPASSPLFTNGAVAPSIGGPMARLRAARSDQAARQAVAELLEEVADAELRQDAAAVESIALALAQHTRSLGSGEGRLATEGGLRRMLREGVVTLLASRIPDSSDRDTLISILARTGEMGGRALVAQLMAAEDRPARRCYFDAIITQDSGVSQLREALSDSRWYVVRNAAALLGEMGMTEADASLIPLLAHLDERIRIAAARALTRLRTVRGLGALQLRLSDTNAEVRRLAAAAYGLSASMAGAPKPHSALLAAALTLEAEEDVSLEMLASLGKLASADAVQRLIRLAMRGAETGTHAGWFRVAALEALVSARGTSSVPTLEVLATDPDEEVATAARRLLGSVLTG